MDRVDHLVWAVPDLDAGISQIEALTGIQAALGGSHPGMGTRNALLSLGDNTYLEIIAPDPGQSDYRSPRLFQVDHVDSPRLVTWAAKSDDIAQMTEMRLSDGQSPGKAMTGSRQTPDGRTLAWELTDPYVEIAGGVVPFFINWGNTPHPAASAPGGATLLALRATHPEKDYVRAAFKSFGINMTVENGRQASLTAVIDTPRGQIELT
jgi:hypothetical protein